MGSPAPTELPGGGGGSGTWGPPVATPGALPALGVEGEARVVLDDGDSKTAIYVWNENILSWEKVADPDFGGGAGDGRVYVSSNDASLGYLYEKLETTSDAVSITEINDGGVETVRINVDLQLVELEGMFKTAYADHYTELSYTGDNLSSVDIWEDSGKTTKLFTRTLSYTGDNLTTVTTTDEQTSSVLTATLTYTGDTLDTVTKALT